MSETEQEIPVRTAVLPSVRTSLAAMKVEAIDAGAAALAVRYAELLDEAVAAQKYASAIRILGRFIDWNNNGPQDQRRQVEQAWDRISAALAEHSVASDLGPKLQAALTALGLTPAGRKEAMAGQAEKTRAEVKQLENPLQVLQGQSADMWAPKQD